MGLNQALSQGRLASFPAGLFKGDTGTHVHTHQHTHEHPGMWHVPLCTHMNTDICAHTHISSQTVSVIESLWIPDTRLNACSGSFLALWPAFQRWSRGRTGNLTLQRRAGRQEPLRPRLDRPQGRPRGAGLQRHLVGSPDTAPSPADLDLEGSQRPPTRTSSL